MEEKLIGGDDVKVLRAHVDAEVTESNSSTINKAVNRVPTLPKKGHSWEARRRGL